MARMCSTWAADSARSHREFGGDARIGPALDEQPEDLQLAAGEAIQFRGRGGDHDAGEVGRHVRGNGQHSDAQVPHRSFAAGR